MIEATVSALRWVQYLAAVAALGLPLFSIYPLGQTRSGPGHRISVAAGLVLAASALGGVVAQTAMMAGSWTAGLDPAALGYVMQSTGLGLAHIARAALALIGVAALLVRPRCRTTSVLAILAFAGALASFAWSGHGATTPGHAGLLHLVADIVHLLAAAIWLGALAGFLLLLARPETFDLMMTARALGRFSTLGTSAVAVLAVTGIVNASFLMGLEGLGRITGSTWGLLLIAKLVLFALMLALAAHNRFTLSPALSRALPQTLSLPLAENGAAQARAPVRRLKISISLEMLAGIALLGLVAAMGVQVPPISL